MKAYSILLIVAITVFNIEAWTGIIPSDPGTEHLGYCYTTLHDIGSMHYGEEKQQKGQCVRLICSDDRRIQQAGCGAALTEPPCTILPQDLSKPYPKCCPRVTCPPQPVAFLYK
ncbi:uncharacterized protein [Diabrotica undecimpunctata]|uniref:uncharacterized protein n=1 Tax=Diabrotica undecimpunctata TaxID=50387 RepID=UPI003B63AD2F